MHPAIEPENWMDLLQALTFMADPDADPSDPPAWATAHEYRLELWADGKHRAVALPACNGYASAMLLYDLAHSR